MYRQNNISNSYSSAYRVQHRLNKGTKLQLRYCVDLIQAERFIKFLLQDEEYAWQTVELYDNQTGELLKVYR